MAKAPNYGTCRTPNHAVPVERIPGPKIDPAVGFNRSIQATFAGRLAGKKVEMVNYIASRRSCSANAFTACLKASVVGISVLNLDLLDFVECDLVTGAIVELGGTRAFANDRERLCRRPASPPNTVTAC
jgi:hypothetical protein